MTKKRDVPLQYSNDYYQNKPSRARIGQAFAVVWLIAVALFILVWGEL